MLADRYHLGVKEIYSAVNLATIVIWDRGKLFNLFYKSINVELFKRRLTSKMIILSKHKN